MLPQLSFDQFTQLQNCDYPQVKDSIHWDMTVAVPEEFDGWKTYVWLGAGVYLMFIPTHLFKSEIHCKEGAVCAKFDDFTVLVCNNPDFHPNDLKSQYSDDVNELKESCDNSNNSTDGYLTSSELDCIDQTGENVELDKGDDNSTDHNKLEVYAAIGCLFLKNSSTSWETGKPYFLVHISEIEDTLLQLAPGSSGLQLFYENQLIGILTGCLINFQEYIIFLNVGYVAQAVRLLPDFKGDPSTYGSLKWMLNPECVEYWSASLAKKFAEHYATNEKLDRYKVAFLIYMCYRLKKKFTKSTYLSVSEYNNLIHVDVIDNWINCLKTNNATEISNYCNNLDFNIALNVNTRASLKDQQLICDMILNTPYAQKNYYPSYIFYATFVDSGRNVPSGCWLPENLLSAYAHCRCMNNYQDDLPPHRSNNDLWFKDSSIPFVDTKSSEITQNDRKIPTACHHPFLCEVSESKEDKKSHKHSHICSLLSHLEMAPKNVNVRHTKLQTLVRKLYSETDNVDTRKQQLEDILKELKDGRL